MNSNNQNKSLSVLQRASPSTLDRADIVIIGNGIAGLTAAIEVRHYNPDKRIVMITDQLHPTINTPALKQFAINKLQREQLLAYPPGTERAERIHIVNAHVEEIHAQSKYIGLNGNRAFGYETLLIATGSKPMGLPEETPGRSFDGVMMLHRLEDYLDLRRRLPEVREAEVIGGGVHANETDMGLLHWGIRVHWLIRGKNFLSRTLDNTASEMVLHNVRRAGAIIHSETEVTAIIGRIGVVAGVVTNTREMIPCQLVLCCTGTRPAQDLAKQCTVPIKFKNGILVDDRLRTSVRDIYAAGDVAALPNPQPGGYEPRAQWYSAVIQGKIAGAMMAGHTEVVKEPFGVQWHATHMGELSMLNVGDPLSTNSQATTYTDTNGGGYRRIVALDDRLIGYLSIGTAQPDSLSIKRLVDEGISIRDIIKPLLKGNFDARGYLASTRTSTARNMLTRQLPPLQEIQAPQVLDVKSYNQQTPALPRIAAPVARQMEVPSIEQQGPYEAREVVAYESYGQPRQSRQNDIPPIVARESQRTPDDAGRYLFFEEEMSPFSGNLPNVNQGDRTAYNTRGSREGRERETNQAVTNQQRAKATSSKQNKFLTDDFNPFTGNLPPFNVVESKIAQKNVSRTPITPQTPVPNKNATRNLWQYVTGDLTE